MKAEVPYNLKLVIDVNLFSMMSPARFYFTKNLLKMSQNVRVPSSGRLKIAQSEFSLDVCDRLLKSLLKTVRYMVQILLQVTSTVNKTLQFSDSYVTMMSSSIGL